MLLYHRSTCSLTVLAVGLALLALAGCSGIRQTPIPTSPGFATSAVEGNESWWACRFRMKNRAEVLGMPL